MEERRHPPFPSERSPLAFFCGRERELAVLRDSASATLDTRGEGVKGIQLVTGVPGAGKTALGTHFGETMNNPKVAFLQLSVETLEGAAGSFEAIMNALGYASAPKNVDVSGKIALDIPGIAKGEVSGGRQTHGEAGPRKLEAMLRQSKAANLWQDKALVLIIDELQTVEMAQRDNIRALHYGTHGCPIMVLGIGLQHTPRVLSALGISRVAQPMTIHSLDEDAARNMFSMNAEVYAGVTDIPDAFMETLLRESHCFPQHVHGYLEGIVKASESHGPDAVRRPGVQREMLEHGHARRVVYYNDRLNSMQNDVDSPRRKLEFLLKVMGGDPSPLDKQDALDALKDCGEDPRKVLSSAIRHGVLRERDESVDFGIPSFHNHMDGLSRQRERARHYPRHASISR